RLSSLVLAFPTPAFFFTDPATPHIYTLSLHDALPILLAILLHGRSCLSRTQLISGFEIQAGIVLVAHLQLNQSALIKCFGIGRVDRKSTRLNSSHVKISYAVFCLKKKKNKRIQRLTAR